MVQPHLQGYGGHGGAVGPQRGHRQEMDQLAGQPPASTEQPPRQVHRKENSIYVFLFWELRGRRPDFRINVSVSYVFTYSRICPLISCSRIGRPILKIHKSQRYTV
jgi:hypothetical protein